MWEGGGGQDGLEWGGKWDNCNSIINKYIFKKKISKQMIAVINSRPLNCPEPENKTREQVNN